MDEPKKPPPPKPRPLPNVVATAKAAPGKTVSPTRAPKQLRPLVAWDWCIIIGASLGLAISIWLAGYLASSLHYEGSWRIWAPLILAIPAGCALGWQLHPFRRALPLVVEGDE